MSGISPGGCITSGRPRRWPHKMTTYVYATGDTGDAGYTGDTRLHCRERGKRVLKSQISRCLVGGTGSVSLQTYKQLTSYKRKNEPSYKRHCITKFSNDIIIFVIQQVDRGQNSKDVHI